MRRFEIGKTYGAWDTAVPAITIIKRTAKTCWVKDDTEEWSMRVKEVNGFEEMTRSAVPAAWRECYTYSTRFDKED